MLDALEVTWKYRGTENISCGGLSVQSLPSLANSALPECTYTELGGNLKAENEERQDGVALVEDFER